MVTVVSRVGDVWLPAAAPWAWAEGLSSDWPTKEIAIDSTALRAKVMAAAAKPARHPWNWEIVAGIIEEGENAEDMIRREVVEKAGLTVTDIVRLYTIMLSPGAMSEACEIFVGRTDTTNGGGVFGLFSESENILVKVATFAEAMAMLDRSEIENSAAVIALQWLALHREELRNRWR